MVVDATLHGRGAAYPWVDDADEKSWRAAGVEVHERTRSGKWINNGEIEDYMARQQHKPTATERLLHFKKVIDWGEATFPHYRSEPMNLVGRDYWAPLSTLSPTSSSAQSAESAPLQRFTFNASNVYQITVGGSLSASDARVSEGSNFCRLARAGSRRFGTRIVQRVAESTVFVALACWVTSRSHALTWLR